MRIRKTDYLCLALGIVFSLSTGCSGVENAQTLPISTGDITGEQAPVVDAGVKATAPNKPDKSAIASSEAPAAAADSGVGRRKIEDTYTKQIDSFDKIVAKGPLGADIIELVARDNMSMVRRCFYDGLKRPGTPVTLRVRGTINAEGGLESAVVEKAPGDVETAECVVDALKRWTFPADGKTGTSFAIPVVMSVEEVTETVIIPAGPPPRIRSSHSSGCCSDGLSKEVMRRIIRRKAGEVEYCRRLDPKKSGTVTVKFIVDGKGKVTMSAVEESTVGSPRVENCLAKSMRRWEFPTPQGGATVVSTYEFVL